MCIRDSAQDERAENVLWRAATNAPLGKAYDEDGKVVEQPLGKNGQVSPLVDEASEVAARHHVLKTNLIANGYLDFTCLLYTSALARLFRLPMKAF